MVDNDIEGCVWCIISTLKWICIIFSMANYILLSHLPLSRHPLHALTLTHTHTHTHKNANSLAAARRSRAPGRARMPVH